MEGVAQKASKTVDRVETDLTVLVAQKEPTYTNLEPQLAKFRTACQDFIFTDFEVAASAKAETRLWDAHAKVNQKFRYFLAKFREDDGKKKHVERRKAEKLYLEFIKSSMRFYRGYIQRLASHFRDLPEIMDVARKFSLDTLTADPPVSVDVALRKQIVRSCYSSLVQLGDLSRYRETELQTKERDWGPAKGYYDLAISLDPHSGVAYNQLAVIALADQDHLRAVYYLYRAITLQAPAPQAPGNLELEFKKIRSRAIQGKAISLARSGEDTTLSDLFIIYHSRCADKAFLGNDVQQDEIFQRLADHLREKPMDSKIRKYCLINIAAEHAVGDRVREDILLLQTYQTLQQFNLSTFFLLIKLMIEEHRELSKGPDWAPDTDERSILSSPVTRRLLSPLRLYSSWLLSRVEYLLASADLNDQMHKFWLAYAEALSLLVAMYPITQIAEIPYLLDEDLDTLGFSPFSDFVREQRIQDAQGRPKPAYGEAQFGKRSLENEMLYRIKCMIRDGFILCRRQFSTRASPLTFASNRFVFQEEPSRGANAENVVSSLHIQDSPFNDLRREEIESADQFKEDARHVAKLHDNISEAAASETSTMEDMVKSLTEPPRRATRPTTFQEDPALNTPTAKSFAESGGVPLSHPSAFTARDLVRQIQRSPSSSFPSLVDPGGSRPMLPSIMNSPFAPLPGETPGTSPRQSTVHRLNPSFSGSPQTRQFQENLVQQQQKIQMWTSPIDSPQPTMSSRFETPPKLTPWNRAVDQFHPALSSPWQSSPPQPFSADVIVPNKPPERAPFGAIGESRPRSSGAPTSGQPG